MTVRKLENGDISTSGVQFVYAEADIEQTILTRLKLWRGEYFRNIIDGTPWIERILGKGISLKSREVAIKRRIDQTPGVKEIISFGADFDLASRTYSANCSVITDTGELVSVNIGEQI